MEDIYFLIYTYDFIWLCWGKCIQYTQKNHIPCLKHTIATHFPTFHTTKSNFHSLVHTFHDTKCSFRTMEHITKKAMQTFRPISRKSTSLVTFTCKITFFFVYPLILLVILYICIVLELFKLYYSSRRT